MQRTSTYRGPGTHTRSRADATTWAGNGLALILAGVSIAAGVVGMLIAFGEVGDTITPFEDGMTWLIGGLVLAIVANFFRREHHIVDPMSDNKFMTGDVLVGNGLGFVLGGLAVAAGVIAMLVQFEYVNDPNVNPFQDALVWFTGAGILAFSALVCRRESHVPDLSADSTPTATRRDTAEPLTHDHGGEAQPHTHR